MLAHSKVLESVSSRKVFELQHNIHQRLHYSNYHRLCRSLHPNSFDLEFTYGGDAKGGQQRGISRGRIVCFSTLLVNNTLNPEFVQSLYSQYPPTAIRATLAT